MCTASPHAHPLDAAHIHPAMHIPLCTSLQTAAVLRARDTLCSGAGDPTDGDVPGVRALSEQWRLHSDPQMVEGRLCWGQGRGRSHASAVPWGCGPFCWALTSGRGPFPRRPAPAFNFQLDLLHSHGNGMQMETGSCEEEENGRGGRGHRQRPAVGPCFLAGLPSKEVPPA